MFSVQHLGKYFMLGITELTQNNDFHNDNICRYKFLRFPLIQDTNIQNKEAILIYNI